MPHAAVLPITYPRLAVVDERASDVLILATTAILSSDDVRVGFGLFEWIAPLELLPLLALMLHAALEGFLKDVRFFVNDSTRLFVCPLTAGLCSREVVVTHLFEVNHSSLFYSFTVQRCD